MKTPYQKLIRDIDQEHASVDTVFETLSKHGLRKLGYGMYSATYGKKDEPYVVKVNFKPDPASFKFYSIISRKKSIYFPKIHKLRPFVTNDGSFLFIVVMERLSRVTNTSWSKANPNGKGFGCWLACHPDGVMDMPYQVPDYENFAEKWARQNSSNVATVSAILSSVRQFGFVDFHDDNIMMRMPEGDVVLTDPVGTH